MDTLKEYILMSEKAVKIQKAWEPKEGDIYTYYQGDTGFAGVKTGNIIKIYLESDIYKPKKNNSYGKFLDDVTWLPRQDDLQGMVFSKKKLTDPAIAIRALFEKIYIRTNTNLAFIDSYYEQFTSMEQLWLAFVMKEKFNKVFNGEDWIKGHLK